MPKIRDDKDGDNAIRVDVLETNARLRPPRANVR